MTCQEFNTLLDAALENRLAPEAMQAFLEHTANCTACHNEYHYLQTLWPSASKIPPQRPYFYSRLHTRITNQSTVSPYLLWIRRSIQPGFAILSVAAGIYLGIVLGDAWIQRSQTIYTQKQQVKILAEDFYLSSPTEIDSETFYIEE